MRRLAQDRKQNQAGPLPANLDAERTVLASLISRDGHATSSMLSVNDFSSHAHRLIYRAIQKLDAAGRPTDIVAVVDELAGDLESAGGAAYVASLLDTMYIGPDVANSIRIVREKAQLRELAQLGELALSANVDASQVLERAKIFSAHIEMEFGKKESKNLFRTAADLAEESDVTEFVVKPYVVAGAVTELVAKIKAGKTTYVLGEIVRQALEKGPVVYLTEQPGTSFRAALGRAQLLGRENLFILLFNAVLGMEWAGIVKVAAEKCDEVEAVLLVVDTLSHFCGLDADSENDSGAAIASMKPLQEVAARGIAVLTVRHERKSGGEISDAGRGSSAFGGAADTLLTLRRPEGRTRPTVRKIECVSRFDGLPAEGIYELVDGRYQYMGTENEIAEREAEQTIMTSPPESEEKAKTLDELLDGSDVARTTGYRVIKKLVAAGTLTQIGKGRRGHPFRYFLPEKVSFQTPHIYGKKENQDRTAGVAVAVQKSATGAEGDGKPLEEGEL